jgi:hypothetical protein
MGSFFKKTIGVIKIVLPFIIEHWKIIFAFSGAIITGILAVLGLIFDIFSHIIETCIELPLWLIFVISPFLIYAIIMISIRLSDAIKKPSYLSFTTMDFMEWKLKWNYEPDKKYEHYLIEDIHAICPICTCRLVPIEYTPRANHETELYCPECRHEPCRNFEPFYRDAKIVIKHRIEMNYTKNAHKVKE